MKPYHRLFEFLDLPWLPPAIRSGVTDILTFFLRQGRLYDPVLPLLEAALDRTGDDVILDCCSGSGGPWVDLYPRLRRQRPGLTLKLCDYFPTEETRIFWTRALEGRAEYLTQRVSVLDIPADLKGFRTLFTAFHHFTPEQARRILADAVEKKAGIGIFECTPRNLLVVLWMLIAPAVAWVVTPFIRPISWKRLVFTYLLPLIPFLLAWDGLVSTFRTYSLRQLEGFTRSLKADYDWQIGAVRGRFCPTPILYLIGTPRRGV